MLTQMTLRLLQKRTFEEAIHVILNDVIALHGAEFGNVQLPIGDELVIAAQVGLSKRFLKAFRRVRKDDGCACGRALRLGAPVVVADVEKDIEYAAFVKDARRAGYRAVQTTPFFTRSGNLVGLVSTHFAQAHEPTPIEMQTLKTYGGVAAEHAYRLLGDVALATKAEQMSGKLYNNYPAGPLSVARRRSPRAPTVP
ncbi:MAG TPA: GAF domain-containing protein [Xanthobacteraceae bacterium]|jgi:GAF domain-containing protein|nr:GAF domain-containing protein [Xanthobacteraceae bacterium]